jgi:membrane protein
VQAFTKAKEERPQCGKRVAKHNRTFSPLFGDGQMHTFSPKQILLLAKESVSAWLEDRAASMGAALAYYTAFSLAPLLIIAIAVAGLVFGRDAAQEAVVAQLQGLLGDAGGAAIEEILKSTAEFGGSILALVIGIGALVLTATTAFVELQDDLDRIWKAEPRAGSGLINLIRSRLLSFGMVLFIGFLLAVSLVLSAGIAALGNSLFGGLELVLHAVTFLISFGVVTALFAMIYKVLPNVKIDWGDVWIGAAITALLFEIGKVLIGLYIGKSSVASSFGAAGPFVVLMLWIYYSTQIFLLGAEFTYAYAHRNQPKGRKEGAPTGIHHASSSDGALSFTQDATASRADVPATAAPLTPAWTKRAWIVSAAGLLTGVAAVRVFRDMSSKFR